jgi:POT family proton-dependent oligopeptide transporter
MLKKHPRGLMVLFFTEMWERFGFYTMMAIYVLYMDEKLGWDDARKGDFYGWFLGAVYFIPIAGGWIGDRVLGTRNTIKTGAVAMSIGFTALAWSSVDRIGLFYLGLVLVAAGTGIFKVNLAVSVGNLYEPGNPLKDAGYNIYYMGVNLGAALAPVAATFVHNVFGSYNISFGMAAAGMVISLVIFQLGNKRIVEPGKLAAPEKSGAGISAGDQRTENRQRVVTLGILFAIVVFFWIAFYQNGFTLTLFAQRSTAVSGILRPETYQFFNPFFILLLTPLVVMIFNRLRAQGREPRSATKIFLGMFVSGFAMVVMVFASLSGGNLDLNIMSPSWLIASYFVVTVSEILVSPMGQSFVSKVAPRSIQGLMMGFWFGGTAIGSYGSGLLGRFYGRFPHHQYFMMLAGLLFLSSLLVLLFMKKLNRFTA